MEKQLIKTRLETFTPAESFTLLCGGRVETIRFADIVRIAKLGIHTVIFTKGSVHRTHRSLQELLRELPVNEFFRISNAQIISLDQVTRFTRRRVHIAGLVLHLTDYYREQLLAELRWMMLRTTPINSVIHDT